MLNQYFDFFFIYQRRLNYIKCQSNGQLTTALTTLSYFHLRSCKRKVIHLRKQINIPERCIKFNFLLGHVLHSLTEALEGHLQFVSQLSLTLFCGEVISVMHVLVFTKISCNFTHFCVELDVYVFLFACRWKNIL